MDIFSDIGKMFTQAAKNVRAAEKKNEEPQEEVKDTLSQLRKELNSAYNALGRTAYELHMRRGGAVPQELYTAIEQLNGKIDKAVERALAEEKGVRCPGCGELQKANSHYCANCGRRMPEEAPNVQDRDDEDREYCPHCGAMRYGEETFCEVCGKAFDEAPEEESAEVAEHVDVPPITATEEPDYAEEVEE